MYTLFKLTALLAILCWPVFVHAQKFYNSRILHNGFDEGKQVRTHTTLYYYNTQLTGNTRVTEGFIIVDRLVEYVANESLLHYATYTYQDTLLTFRGTTTKGKKNGTFLTFPPGNVFYLHTYRDDELEGEFKGFYTIGQLYCEGYHDNNKQSGLYKQYYANGKLSFTKQTAEGVDQLSHMAHYYVNGVMESTGSYYRERKVNEWYYYSKQGELSKKEYYTNKGRLIKVR